MIFASTVKNKEALENYTELWDENKDENETISGNKLIKCGRDFMKIRFTSDNDLPLGKILSIPVCIIAVGSVFQEDNDYYPQVYLHECLCEFEHNYEREDYFFEVKYMLFLSNSYIRLLFIYQLHKVSFIHCFCFIRQNLNIYST